MKSVSIVWILLLSLHAHAKEMERIALVIGVNNGLEQDVELNFADDDAQKIAGVLKSSPYFEESKVHTLINPTVTETWKELREVESEFQGESKNRFLMIYYSGHGSSDALHINGEKLSRSDFLDAVSEFDAEVKLVIVDACEAGHFIRNKGAKMLDPHEFKLENHLDHKGMIIITSSAKGELAQESQNYKGSVFTYHLSNGLLGLADFNNDQMVDVWEAYSYASNCTKTDNILGKTNTQTPNFDFDLIGSSELYLNKFNRDSKAVVLNNFNNTQVDFYNMGTMKLFKSVYVMNQDSVFFQLPANRYYIVARDDHNNYVGKLNFNWLQTQTIDFKELTPFSKKQIQFKGNSITNINHHRLGAQIKKVNTALLDHSTFVGVEYLFEYQGMSYFSGALFSRTKKIGRYHVEHNNLFLFELGVIKNMYQSFYLDIPVRLGLHYILKNSDIDDLRVDEVPALQELDKVETVYHNSQYFTGIEAGIGARYFLLSDIHLELFYLPAIYLDGVSREQRFMSHGYQFNLGYFF